MAEEYDIDLDQDVEKEHPVDKRLTKAFEKIGSTEKELNEERKLREAEAQKSAELQKERDFYAGFTDIISTHPEAKDHKDDILAKVKGGYSVEDATFAVLGKAGKLSQPQPIVDNPAGGAATITQTSQGQKTLDSMSREEKRAKLLEAESRGDISMS